MFLSCSANAYETVAVKFPLTEGWRMVEYLPSKPDSMVHYAPSGNFKDNYIEAVFCHSYKSNQRTLAYAQSMLNKEMGKITQNISNVKTTPITTNGKDVMQWWCGDTLNGKHCEIMRATPSQEGAMLIRYVNKNEIDFQNKRIDWTERVRLSAIYYSYFRMNHVLNKEIYYEL